MNNTQKKIILVAIAVICFMLLYPPYEVVFRGVTYNQGYGLLFSPPKRGYITASVNIPLLLIQFAVILLVSGLLVFINKKDIKDSTESNLSKSKPSLGIGFFLLSYIGMILCLIIVANVLDFIFN